MMFNVMHANNLYPPQYKEVSAEAQEAIVVTLLNEERPPIWEQVSDWMDRQGPLSNGDLCQIAGLDTLRASKMLRRWVDQGLLTADASRGKRNTVYLKPFAENAVSRPGPLSEPPDNETPPGFN